MVETIEMAQVIDERHRCSQRSSQQRNHEGKDGRGVQRHLITRRHDKQDDRTEDRRDESGIDEAFDHGSNQALDETQDAPRDGELWPQGQSLRHFSR
jgi:hypothetical protein